MDHNALKFRNFSLFCIFFNLKMVCSGAGFLHLSCLMFSEFPGFVVKGLPLIWTNYQPLLFVISLVPFFSTYNRHFIYLFVVVTQSMNILCLFFSVFVLFAFQFLQFIDIVSNLEIISSAMSHIQKKKKAIEGILCFCYTVLDV